MAVTETETAEPQAVAGEVDLATISDVFPPGTTVGVRRVAEHVLEITRNDATFTVEIGVLGTVAEVTLRDGQPPERIPAWLGALVEQRYDVHEVTL